MSPANRPSAASCNTTAGASKTIRCRHCPKDRILSSWLRRKSSCRDRDDSRSAPDFVGKMGAKLGQLRRDDNLTIALIRIVAEITLVIIFGAVERFERHHLRHHGNAVVAGSVQG